MHYARRVRVCLKTSEDPPHLHIAYTRRRIVNYGDWRAEVARLNRWSKTKYDRIDMGSGTVLEDLVCYEVNAAGRVEKASNVLWIDFD
jgi:hypothetical protein